MEGNTGPQASTRHIKERRPTFHTQAGRSLAALEQRIISLEGQPIASPSSPGIKHTTAIDLDSTLHKFGQTFNGLEDRVTSLENDIANNSGFITRLQDLEDRLKPYEEYRTQATAAVQQLKGAKTEFETFRRSINGPYKDYATLSEQVASQAASIEAFQHRLEQVDGDGRRTSIASLASESNRKRKRGAPMKYTTNALAKEITRRLSRGDSLIANIHHELCLALEAPTGRAT